MHKPVAATAQCHKIIRVIIPAFRPRYFMMHLQKVSMIAPRPFTLMPGTGQDKAPGGWRYGGGVALAGLADLAIIQGLV